MSGGEDKVAELTTVIAGRSAKLSLDQYMYTGCFGPVASLTSWSSSTGRAPPVITIYAQPTVKEQGSVEELGADTGRQYVPPRRTVA
jgi:hypothetical protein